jgi:hypothetical protein
MQKSVELTPFNPVQYGLQHDDRYQIDILALGKAMIGACSQTNYCFQLSPSTCHKD